MMMRRINLNDLEQDNYMKFYKFLLGMKDLSGDAKILYTVLRDRLRLSLKSVQEGNYNFVDKNGDVFVKASIENIMEMINCGNQKAIKLKKELVKHGLIEDVRTGLNKSNMVYILEIDQVGLHKKYVESLNRVRKCENHISGSVKITLQEMWKSHSTKNNFTKNNFTNTTTKENYGNLVTNQTEEPKKNNCTRNKEDMPTTNTTSTEKESIQEEQKQIIATKKESTQKTKKQKKAKLTLSKEDINRLQTKLNQKVNAKVKDNTLIKIATYYGEYLENTIDKLDKIRSKKIKSLDGWLFSAVEAEATGTPYNEHQGVQHDEKPVQCTNYEQREYDDDYFESLYDN